MTWSETSQLPMPIIADLPSRNWVVAWSSGRALTPLLMYPFCPSSWSFPNAATISGEFIGWSPRTAAM